jgi:ligand-binding sensor domain-containing protein
MAAWLLLVLGAWAAGARVAAAERSLAQPYVWRSWTRLDGLPGSQVWAITQDHAGYIWLGTNEGLVRFDGVRFVSGRQLGFERVPNASVRALFVARDGSLWIGFGTGGIGRLKDRRLQMFAAEDGLPPGVVAGIVEDRRGLIWAASANGLYRLQSGHWSRVSLSTDVPTGVIDAVYADQQGRLWVGSRAGVFRSPSDAPTRFERVATMPAQSFAEDQAGHVWTVSDAGPILLTDGPPRAVSAAAAYAPGQRVVADREGQLWVATLGDGLLRVTPASNVVDQIRRPGTSSYDLVLSVFQDREGNIWAGTPRGLDRGSKGLIRSLPEPGDGITAPVQAVSAPQMGSIALATESAGR